MLASFWNTCIFQLKSRHKHKASICIIVYNICMYIYMYCQKFWLACHQIWETYLKRPNIGGLTNTREMAHLTRSDNSLIRYLFHSTTFSQCRVKKVGSSLYDGRYSQWRFLEIRNIRLVETCSCSKFGIVTHTCTRENKYFFRNACVCAETLYICPLSSASNEKAADWLLWNDNITQKN